MADRRSDPDDIVTATNELKESLERMSANLDEFSVAMTDALGYSDGSASGDTPSTETTAVTSASPADD